MVNGRAQFAGDMSAMIGRDSASLIKIAIMAGKKMAGRIKRYAATVAPFCSAVDIQEPIDCGEPTEAVIGASIGIAVFPDDGDDALSLVEAADRAMYEVKKAGKNDAKLASEVPK